MFYLVKTLWLAWEFPRTNSWGLSENVEEGKLVGLVPRQKLA